MSKVPLIYSSMNLILDSNTFNSSDFTCYFDYPQSQKEKKHAWWMTYTPVKKVSSFNPESKFLSAQQNKNIIGGEATLWTEYVTNEKELWHQLMPRLKALGESFKKQQ